MELNERVAVITGAASGIGRAMALRFADEGARGVVVSDLDRDGAAEVAAELDARRPGAAIAVTCDASDPAQVERLIDRTEVAFGPIDLFCANAGVGVGSGLESTEAEWDVAFGVNVRAHITAARLLIPGWVERGEGYFLATASAAGLLGVIGSAPYAVTKHAAVAFAEWLAVTYGERGVRVSCLCPMGVRTKLLEDGLASPGEVSLGLRIATAAGKLLDPAEVAEAVVNGVADERFLILPHPQVHDLLRGKVADPDAWLAGMQAARASGAAV